MKRGHAHAVAHLGFTQSYPASPGPADDLCRAVVIRLRFSQRPQGEAELGGRIQVRPEIKQNNKVLDSLVHALEKKEQTQTASAGAEVQITEDKTQQKKDPVR